MSDDGAYAAGLKSGLHQSGSVNRLKAIGVAFRCFVRRSPLFVSRTPGTPLRVLCVIAFDAVRRMQTGIPLSREQVQLLARSLKLAARANAILDGKTRRDDSLEAVHRDMLRAGTGPLAEQYLTRLRRLENRRPQPLDLAQHSIAREGTAVRTYREDVVRLSLAFAFAVITPPQSLDECQRVIDNDACVSELFRICMLCQIIDDMLDYAKDRIAGLPTFLTMPQSLPNAIALTGASVRAYSPRLNLTSPDADTSCLFRLSRQAIAATATLLVVLCRLRHGKPSALR